MRKRRYRLLIPAVAPLLLKSGYLLEAWRHSPLDRWDWCFFLLAGILTAAGWKRIRNWAGRPDWRGLWFLLPAVAVWGAGIVKQVNAVQTGGALLILFSSLFVLGGVRLFSGMLPILLIALAGCPSTTYWSEYYIRISAGTAPVGGLAFKCCAAAALSVYFLRAGRVYRLQTLLFVLGVLLLIGVLYSRESRAGYGQPLLIDPERTEVGGYLGFPSALSEQEQRFFEGHAVRRAVYYGSVENIRLLAVGITGDIHRIHPAELCLKSMDCDVLSSREKILNPGGRPLAALSEPGEGADLRLVQRAGVVERKFPGIPPQLETERALVRVSAFDPDAGFPGGGRGEIAGFPREYSLPARRAAGEMTGSIVMISANYFDPGLLFVCGFGIILIMISKK